MDANLTAMTHATSWSESIQSGDQIRIEGLPGRESGVDLIVTAIERPSPDAADRTVRLRTSPAPGAA